MRNLSRSLFVMLLAAGVVLVASAAFAEDVHGGPVRRPVHIIPVPICGPAHPCAVDPVPVMPRPLPLQPIGTPVTPAPY